MKYFIYSGPFWFGVQWDQSWNQRFIICEIWRFAVHDIVYIQPLQMVVLMDGSIPWTLLHVLRHWRQQLGPRSPYLLSLF